MKTNHIYWFSHYNLSCPSTRYRGKYALDFLSENYKIGHSFVMPGYSMNCIRKFVRVYFFALFSRRKRSYIVIQKVFSNGIYAYALKLLVLLRRNKTIYDLDDAEYIRHDDKTLNFFLKNCSLVTVGSKALQDYAFKFNEKVILNTSPVIPHHFIKKEKNEKMTIGWIGDLGNGNQASNEFSHKKSLFKLFFPALINIDKPVKLILIGVNRIGDIDEIRNYFSANINIDLDIPETIDWLDENGSYERISEFDIGIAPLVDHEFNRAKSAFKVKQYLSCGVPVLASKVGENSRFIKDGLNGYFCDNPEDFRKALLEFYGFNDELYLQLSRNALETVKQFTLKGYCEILIDAIESHCSGNHAYQ